MRLCDCIQYAYVYCMIACSKTEKTASDKHHRRRKYVLIVKSRRVFSRIPVKNYKWLIIWISCSQILLAPRTMRKELCKQGGPTPYFSMLVLCGYWNLFPYPLYPLYLQSVQNYSAFQSFFDILYFWMNIWFMLVKEIEGFFFSCT